MSSITVGPSPPSDRLSLESIPTVDLRLLSQSELTALSLCSSHAFDLRRCDDVVIPKIDRSVFNESAGSRKQTYSRLRLAPRNPNPNPDRAAISTPRPSPSPLDSENSRIISLFKTLFNGSHLVPVNVEYSDVVLGSKRGRKPKTEAGENEREVVNKNGVEVDLVELGKMEDPYGEEIRRRTQGKDRPEELLGFIRDLKGQWGSRRKKRKIVDANEFGDALPNGWKILIAIKKKQGRAWLFCRRYISPNGRYFVSCKDVSSYLLSLISPQDLKQQTTVQCLKDSAVDNNLASENAAEMGTMIDHSSLCVTSQSNDRGNQQKHLSTSQTLDREKQLILSKDVHVGEVQGASALKCHKCSTAFGEKDDLLNHLLSCHKRKRRKAGAPIEDDVLAKDGKYECQFCDKILYERSSYFGHVGIHVKNYVKSIAGSPILTAKQKTLGSAEVTADSIAGTPNILASGELNLNSVDSKLKASSDAEIHLGNVKGDQNNFSLHVELNVEAVQQSKSSVDESSSKQDGDVHTTDSNVREVDEATADFSAVKPSGYGKVLCNNGNNVLCNSSSVINATKCMGSEISKSPALPMENAETCLLPDNKQVDLGNDGNLVADNLMQNEGVISENGLPAINKESLSGNQNSEDRYLGSTVVEHTCFDEKVANNVGLMDGSGSGHLDLSVDAANDVQLLQNVEKYSAVLHKEEETCGISANKIERMGSTLTESNQISSCTPSRDQSTTVMQNYIGKDFASIVNEMEMGMCSLEKTEVTVGAESCIARERHCESIALVSRHNGCSYIGNEAETAPDVEMVEPRETGGLQVEKTCSIENSTGAVSCRNGEEPKIDQDVNSSNLFFISGRGDMHLNANAMTNNDQAHIDLSNVVGGFNNFVDDKQEQVPKNILSGFSIDGHACEVPINNVTNISSPATAAQLPEHDKAESSRTNKLIFDFGSTAEINERFMNSVQHETVPEGSSPFSLWGQQTSSIEDNQTRVYGGARGLAQQERALDNNSFNLGCLQQSSDAGCNLSKIQMNEQRYGVLHDETGVYSRSTDATREVIPHGNTLNLAGLQQQCDAGYNLNKPSINQQSYGVQHNESGACNTSDEVKQERVAYGNSLSLASLQQTCDTRYGLNKACVQQTCDTEFSLNKEYMGTIQRLSKLDDLGHSRDMDLMIGFGNSGGRPNQGVGTEFIWRATEGNILPGGLMESSSAQGQSSGSFQAFDFLSDKGGNDLYTANDKFDNISSFEGLRPTSVEPMEFSFMTTQESNNQLEHQKVLSYNAQMDQSFGSSIWHQKPTSLPNMMAGHVVSTLCVWCGNEFHQDSVSCEMQAGSIGFLCPTCKARMSGQFL